VIVNSYEVFFFQEVTAKCPPAVAEAISKIHEWSKTMHGCRWGAGKDNPALHILGPGSKVAYLAADGWAWPALGALRKVPPFSANPRLLDELVSRLKVVPRL
jgi:hypothetical protein